MQAANDIALARSPSPPPTHRHRHSVDSITHPSVGGQPSHILESSIISEHIHEETPLLNHEHAPQKQGHSHSHSHGSMNMHALLLHVLGDALGNVGVIATGLIIWLTEWKYKFYCDPVISLVITIIIFSSALPLGEYPICCIRCPLLTRIY